MVLKIAKRVASLFPRAVQQELKRLHYARQIRRGLFLSEEPEAKILGEFLTEGDWAIDIGANIGHYTLAMSKVVGASGRVIALEPMPRTFALLAGNLGAGMTRNVTPLNIAASERCAVLRMSMPTSSDTGLDNPYMAAITDNGDTPILTLSLDSLALTGTVALVKIDAEGHELSVIRGMRALLTRDRPTLIVEGSDTEVEAYLTALGYGFRVLPGSWNRIYFTVDRGAHSG